MASNARGGTPARLGQHAHLLPPSWERVIPEWLAEDTPSMDYGGFVVGEQREQAALYCKAPVRLSSLAPSFQLDRMIWLSSSHAENTGYPRWRPVRQRHLRTPLVLVRPLMRSLTGGLTPSLTRGHIGPTGLNGTLKKVSCSSRRRKNQRSRSRPSPGQLGCSCSASE